MEHISYFLALGFISGFDTSDQTACAIERMVTLTFNIGMGMDLMPDFNNIEWGTDDYPSYSRYITIRSVSARVSLENVFLGKKLPRPEVGHRNCSGCSKRNLAPVSSSLPWGELGLWSKAEIFRTKYRFPAHFTHACGSGRQRLAL